MPANGSRFSNASAPPIDHNQLLYGNLILWFRFFDYRINGGIRGLSEETTDDPVAEVPDPEERE